MAQEVGSVSVKGTYEDAGLTAGLDSIVTNAKQVQISSQGVTTEFERQEKSAKTLGATLVGLGAAGSMALYKLVSSSAPLQGAFARINAAMTLLANTIGKDVKPVFDWIADKIWDIVKAFRSLDPEVRKAISYFIILSAIVVTISGFIGGLIALIWGKAGLTAAFVAVKGAIVGAVTWFLAGSAAAIAFAASIGLIIGFIGVWLLQKAGVLAWITDLGATVGTFLVGKGKEFGDWIVDAGRKFGELIGQIKGVRKVWEKLLSLGASGGFGSQWVIPSMALAEHRTGGMASYTGMHWLEAGETVNPVGVGGESSGGNTYEISFAGANFNLASGLDVEEFADSLMRAIAWKSSMKSTSRG